MIFPLGNGQMTVKRRPAMPVIVLACFGRSPAARALGTALATLGRVLVVEDRRHLLKLFQCRGDLLVLPVVGGDGMPTSPLLDRLAAQHKPIVVCRLRASDTAGLVAAARAGANILHLPSGPDLVASCRHHLSAPSLSVAERRALEATLAGLHPPGLRVVLIVATLAAHQRLSVARLSALCGVSSRTLDRWTSDARWPSPRDLIAWGRLLRAAIAQWHGVHAFPLLARLSGFPSVDTLAEATTRFVDPSSHLDRLTPLRVSRALRRQLALG
jgi:hypothetical protein